MKLPISKAVSIPVVCGFLSCACFAGMNMLGDMREHLPRFFLLTSAAFGMLLLAFRVWDTAAFKKRGYAFGIVLLVAIVSRLTLIGIAPSLSDDLYRYLWDGRILAHGYNPYANIPSDTVFAQYHDETYNRIGYKNYYSLYPPLTELGLGASAWIANACFGGSTEAESILWKCMLIIADIGTILLLARILSLLRKDMKYLLLYAWHPLPIIEFAGQGHSDALMIFCLMGVVYSVMSAQRRLPAILYAAAIASRGIPIVFAPAFLRYISIKGILISLGIALCLFLPFYSSAALHGIMYSTSQVAQFFTFNSFGYWSIRSVFEQLRAWNYESFIPVILAVIFCGGLTWLYVKSRKNTAGDLPQDMLDICTLCALVFVNMHPWYFTWGLALVPLTASYAWLWIGFVVQFTYIHYTPHSDDALITIGVIEYGVFILLLLWSRMNRLDTVGKPKTISSSLNEK